MTNLQRGYAVPVYLSFIIGHLSLIISIQGGLFFVVLCAFAPLW